MEVFANSSFRSRIVFVAVAVAALETVQLNKSPEQRSQTRQERQQRLRQKRLDVLRRHGIVRNVVVLRRLENVRNVVVDDVERFRDELSERSRLD